MSADVIIKVVSINEILAKKRQANVLFAMLGAILTIRKKSG